ncbi:MAG: hypothetical protein P4M11_00975, partial [Candidatus Pacebacteria bacterium]|nr:hypothetical protein [Candidatus Paceibacterota bacterium]
MMVLSLQQAGGESAGVATTSAMISAEPDVRGTADPSDSLKKAFYRLLRYYDPIASGLTFWMQLTKNNTIPLSLPAFPGFQSVYNSEAHRTQTSIELGNVALRPRAYRRRYRITTACDAVRMANEAAMDKQLMEHSLSATQTIDEADASKESFYDELIDEKKRALAAAEVAILQPSWEQESNIRDAGESSDDEEESDDQGEKEDESMSAGETDASKAGAVDSEPKDAKKTDGATAAAAASSQDVDMTDAEQKQSTQVSLQSHCARDLAPNGIILPNGTLCTFHPPLTLFPMRCDGLVTAAG